MIRTDYMLVGSLHQIPCSLAEAKGHAAIIIKSNCYSPTTSPANNRQPVTQYGLTLKGASSNKIWLRWRRMIRKQKQTSKKFWGSGILLQTPIQSQIQFDLVSTAAAAAMSG